MTMFDFLSKKKKLNISAHKLFSKVIEQSRDTFFYTDLDVEDSLDGRFDLMAIHMTLVIEKLDNNQDNADAGQIKRHLQEIMFDNLDLTLREIGVGDLGVGKKIKVMAEAFYGRMTTYQKLFKNKDVEQMSLAIGRNLYRGHDVNKIILSKISSYVYGQVTHINNQSIQDILDGNIDFMPIQNGD